MYFESSLEQLCLEDFDYLLGHYAEFGLARYGRTQRVEIAILHYLAIC